MCEIILKEGTENMDFVMVTEMLTQSYWSPGIEIEEVVKGAYNSALVVGAFNRQGEQIGFARAISDKTRYAYILDVIVHENYRHQEIGAKLIKSILDSEELADVYIWQLTTGDAHTFYKKFGFEPIERFKDLLEIRIARSDKKKSIV